VSPLPSYVDHEDPADCPLDEIRAACERELATVPGVVGVTFLVRTSIEITAETGGWFPSPEMEQAVHAVGGRVRVLFPFAELTFGCHHGPWVPIGPVKPDWIR